MSVSVRRAVVGWLLIGLPVGLSTAISCSSDPGAPLVAGSPEAGALSDGGAGLTDGPSDAVADAGARLLSQTGLYADIAQGTLATGVRTFTPQAALWADGADKERWVWLPPGSQIDTSSMDGWQFPVGTKVWKQFSLRGQRLETRLLEKTAAQTWTMVAFAWSADLSDAVAVPAGVPDAGGTPHDIPSSDDCQRCHAGVTDSVIGFSAIQLAHPGDGVTLATLVQEGWLTSPPATTPVVPGSDTERDALLYLHANCANCHNSRTFIANATGVDYSLTVGQLGSVAETNSSNTLLADLRRAGDVVAQTHALERMQFRGLQGQMPPVGSKVVDQDGVHLVQAWLTLLAADGGASTFDAGSSDSGDAAHHD